MIIVAFNFVININSFLGLKYILVYIYGWMDSYKHTMHYSYIIFPSVFLGSWDTLQPRSSMLITRVEIARSWWIQCLQLLDISMCLLFIAGWVLMCSWKLCCGGLPAFLAFFGLEFLLSAPCLPFFCYPSSFLLCVCFSTYFFFVVHIHDFGGSWYLHGKKSVTV